MDGRANYMHYQRTTDVHCMFHTILESPIRTRVRHLACTDPSMRCWIQCARTPRSPMRGMLRGTRGRYTCFLRNVFALYWCSKYQNCCCCWSLEFEYSMIVSDMVPFLFCFLNLDDLFIWSLCPARTPLLMGSYQNTCFCSCHWEVFVWTCSWFYGTRLFLDDLNSHKTQTVILIDISYHFFIS